MAWIKAQPPGASRRRMGGSSRRNRRRRRLHHADRDDPVKWAGDFAIVLLNERDLVRGARPLARGRKLLGRDIQAGDVHVTDLRQIDRQRSPARSDVEHSHAGGEHELGSNMPQLVELRGLELHPPDA